MRIPKDTKRSKYLEDRRKEAPPTKPMTHGLAAFNKRAGERINRNVARLTDEEKSNLATNANARVAFKIDAAKRYKPEGVRRMKGMTVGRKGSK